MLFVLTEINNKTHATSTSRDQIKNILIKKSIIKPTVMIFIRNFKNNKTHSPSISTDSLINKSIKQRLPSYYLLRNKVTKPMSI